MKNNGNSSLFYVHEDQANFATKNYPIFNFIFHKGLPDASPSPKTAAVCWYQSASALIWHSHIWSDLSQQSLRFFVLSDGSISLLSEALRSYVQYQQTLSSL